MRLLHRVPRSQNEEVSGDVFLSGSFWGWVSSSSFRLLTKLSALRWEARGSRFLVGCQLEPLSAPQGYLRSLPCCPPPPTELVMRFQIISHLESLTSPFAASLPMPAGETHLTCSFSTSESLELEICRIFLYSVLTLGNLSKEKDIYWPPGTRILQVGTKEQKGRRREGFHVDTEIPEARREMTFVKWNSTCCFWLIWSPCHRCFMIPKEQRKEKFPKEKLNRCFGLQNIDLVIWWRVLFDDGIMKLALGHGLECALVISKRNLECLFFTKTSFCNNVLDTEGFD